jgi:5-methylcytosine-specific restriction endonuclease McrA
MATKPRDYRKEYDTYQKNPDQRHKNDLRKKARREMEKENGKKKIPKGFDVDHRIPLDKGGTSDRKNLRLLSAKKNRGFRRNKNNQPI